MRVIYLTVATIPNKTAHSKYVIKLCEAIANQGINTTIISGRPITDRHKLDLNSNRFPVKENRYKSLILATFHFICILKRKIFLQSKNDIYIVHNTFSALACVLLRVKYVIDMHAKIFNSIKAKKILFKHLPIVWIVQSALLREYTSNEIGVDKEDILLSRNAISGDNRAVIPNGFLTNDKRFAFAYIGRLKPDTGFDEIVKASNELNKSFVIYVGGDYYRYKDYYEQLFIKYPNAKEKIIFLGYLNDEEINFISQNADALIALYNSNIDIFGTLSPMKIFEYLNFKKIIIAPKIDDIEEIINYYNCEERMRWYEVDNMISLKNTLQSILEEEKKQYFKHIQVETWDVKAQNILERIGQAANVSIN